MAIVVTACTPNLLCTAGGGVVRPLIRGSGFTGFAGTITCKGATVSTFTVVDDTTISFVVPAASAGVGDLVVGGVGAGNSFVTYWDPSQITGILSWYDAELGVLTSTGVSQWADQQGTNTLSQPTAGQQPAYAANAFGSLHGVQFTAATHLLTTSARVSMATGLSYFGVIKTTDARNGTPGYAGDTANTLIGDTTGSVSNEFGIGGTANAPATVPGQLAYNQFAGGWTGASAGNPVNVGRPLLIGLTHSTGNVATFYQGKDVVGSASLTYDTVNNGWNTVGGSFSSTDWFAGTVGAVVIVSGVISAGDLALLAQWSYQRFGVQLAPGVVAGPPQITTILASPPLTPPAQPFIRRGVGDYPRPARRVLVALPPSADLPVRQPRISVGAGDYPRPARRTIVALPPAAELPPPPPPPRIGAGDYPRPARVTQVIPPAQQIPPTPPNIDVGVAPVVAAAAAAVLMVSAPANAALPPTQPNVDVGSGDYPRPAVVVQVAPPAAATVPTQPNVDVGAGDYPRLATIVQIAPPPSALLPVQPNVDVGVGDYPRPAVLLEVVPPAAAALPPPVSITMGSGDYPRPAFSVLVALPPRAEFPPPVVVRMGVGDYPRPAIVVEVLPPPFAALPPPQPNIDVGVPPPVFGVLSPSLFVGLPPRAELPPVPSSPVGFGDFARAGTVLLIAPPPALAPLPPPQPNIDVGTGDYPRQALSTFVTVPPNALLPPPVEVLQGAGDYPRAALTTAIPLPPRADLPPPVVTRVGVGDYPRGAIVVSTAVPPAATLPPPVTIVTGSGNVVRAALSTFVTIPPAAVLPPPVVSRVGVGDYPRLARGLFTRPVETPTTPLVPFMRPGIPPAIPQGTPIVVVVRLPELVLVPRQPLIAFITPAGQFVLSVPPEIRALAVNAYTILADVSGLVEVRATTTPAQLLAHVSSQTMTSMSVTTSPLEIILTEIKPTMCILNGTERIDFSIRLDDYINPTTLSVTVVSPSGTPATYSYPSANVVQRTDSNGLPQTGRFRAFIPVGSNPSDVGVWHYRINANAGFPDVAEGTFSVLAPSF